jgi:hypothetical protein
MGKFSNIPIIISVRFDKIEKSNQLTKSSIAIILNNK